jgi:hypothetical protein
MLAEAKFYRAHRFDSTEALAMWCGYLTAMCGATDATPDQLELWLDSHPETASYPSPVAVAIRRRARAVPGD